MPIRRVLITGATGFIGGRLCEVMTLSGLFEPRALVHSTASVARIARLPIEFTLGDLCEPEAAARAVKGCDAVVHLARGDDRVMHKGLKNILHAAAKSGIQRFVHMSSVAVYGNRPRPESVSESAPASSPDNAYGQQKLQQERLVHRYARRYRLPAVILRPPNVYGPFSPFTLGLLGKIRSRTMAIVNGGKNPCNLVYVDNLVNAVLLALVRPEAAGEVFFITDSGVVDWRQCLTDHAQILGVSLPHVSETDLIPPRPERFIRDSLRALPRVLFSGEFRTLMRQVPLVRKTEALLYGIFQALPAETQQNIRLWLTGPRRISPSARSQPTLYAQDNIIAAQFRQVAHSSEKARRLLGYSAPISYREGMTLTEMWLRFARLI